MQQSYLMQRVEEYTILAVVEKLGFQYEGLSKQYLMING
jgi:hypothetical protein